MRIQERLLDFVEQEFGAFRDNPSVAVDEPLLPELIDSIGMLRLALYIADTFGVRVDDGDVLPENFGTIERLTRYVERKLDAVAT